MEENHEHSGTAWPLVKRVLAVVAVAAVSLCLVACIAGVALFGNELKTLGTISKIDEYPLYTMEYVGDYGIDEFLEQGGASNDAELIDFVVGRLLKGLPVKIELPNLACSTFNAETPDLYTMEYVGDYGIDEFLEQGGASNDAELIDFVVGRLLKGLPVKIELPNLACSTFNAETPEGDAVFGRIDFVVGRLLKGLPVKIELPNLACSTFNAETPEGDAVFGRNFDLEFSPGMMVRTAPKDGYASISMVNLAFIGYGAEKLPDDFASSIVSLAAPFAPLDGW